MKKVSPKTTLPFSTSPRYFLLFLLCFTVSLRVIIPSQAQAQVKVIKAPTSYEFRDMGYDSATGQVGIVGYEVSGATKTAKVFGINATNDGLTSSTLVGFGNPVYIAGISSDASRIVGSSKSSGSVSIGEGTTWLRSSPNSPTGIGYLAGLCANTSIGVSAWKDGVVGDCGGGAQAIKWTPSGGMVALGGHSGGGAFAADVTSNGVITVGVAGHEVAGGAAYYWDATGIHKLQDPFNAQSAAYAISPSGSYIGGFVSEDDLSEEGILHAAIWDGTSNPKWNLILLKDAAGNPFQGRVLDISNLGYAVGETRDGKGFIWHKSFDGIQSPYRGAQIFDTWLATIPGGVVLSPASKGVEAIAENTVSGKLLFALSDYEAPGASFYVEASVPGVGQGNGNLPTHVGTTGNDRFDITISAANQRVYVQGLGGDDIINITATSTGTNANVTVEGGTGIDRINLRADTSNFKSSTISGDGADIVTLTSYNGINIDSNFDLGEGNDSFTNYLYRVRTAVVGVKAQGGVDTIKSTTTSSQAVVTAYDLGSGNDDLTSSVSSSDLSLAINASLGDNILKLNGNSAIITQGVIIGDGKNNITEAFTSVNTTVSAYSFGYGSNTYAGNHTLSSGNTVTLVEPRLTVPNKMSFKAVSDRNIGINCITPNAGDPTITNVASTGVVYRKYTTQPSGLSTGTQVYNQIVNTFNPYN